MGSANAQERQDVDPAALAALVADGDDEVSLAQQEADFLAEFEEDGTGHPANDPGRKGQAAADAADADDSDDSDGEDGEDGDGQGEPAGDAAAGAAAGAGQEPARGDGQDDHLAARVRRLEGRFGREFHDIKQMIQALGTTQRQQAKAEGTAAPSAQQLRDALASGPKMQALKSEFPEYFDGLQEALEMAMGQMRTAAPEIDLDRIRQETAREILPVARQLSILDTRRPDWEAEVLEPEFADWLADQPEAVRLRYQSDRAADLLAVLEAYRPSGQNRDQQTPSDSGGRQGSAASRQRRLDSAAPATSGGSRRTATTPSELDDFLDAFEKGQ